MGCWEFLLRCIPGHKQFLLRPSMGTGFHNKFLLRVLPMPDWGTGLRRSKLSLGGGGGGGGLTGSEKIRNAFLKPSCFLKIEKENIEDNTLPEEHGQLIDDVIQKSEERLAEVTSFETASQNEAKDREPPLSKETDANGESQPAIGVMVGLSWLWDITTALTRSFKHGILYEISTVMESFPLFNMFHAIRPWSTIEHVIAAMNFFQIIEWFC